MSDDALLEAADRLYGLPLPDFTPARDALAKDLRAEDRPLSDRVKKLKKPSVAAWAVNLLVRGEAGQLDQVLTVGAALREAQASLDGDELRALTRQRRQLTAAVTKQARALAAQHGQRLTGSVADQVEATLTAAMLDAGAAEAVRSGLLVTALAATGVDELDLAGAVGVPESAGFTPTPLAAGSGVDRTGADQDEEGAATGLHVVPDPDADTKRLAAARQELADAEDQRNRAAAAVRAAERDVEALEARSLQVQSEIDELRRRLGELEDTAEDVDDQLTDARSVAESARADAASADAERDRIAARVAELEG